MTEAEAQAELKRPLVFGDDRQIRAIRLLNSISEAVAAIYESPVCEECDGRGEIEEPCAACEVGSEKCLECDDGIVTSECIACSGVGFFVMDWPAVKNEVMAAAIDRIKRNRRRDDRR